MFDNKRKNEEAEIEVRGSRLEEDANMAGIEAGSEMQ